MTENRDQFSELPIVWQGSVPTWHCDMMGHMNTRFYASRMEEAMVAFSRHIGRERGMALTSPFYNIRFLKEATAGMSMRMRMGMAKRDFHHDLFGVLQSIDDSSVLASYRCSLDNQILPPHIREEFERPVPGPFAPRSFNFEHEPAPVPVDPRELDYVLISAGALTEDHCDARGVMRLSEPTARVSDGMPHFMARVREEVARHAQPKPQRVGGAMLEARIDLHQEARLGDRFEVWGAITRIGAKTFTIESRMIDPANNHVYAHMRHVSVVFDLDRRSAIQVAVPAREALQSILPKVHA